MTSHIWRALRNDGKRFWVHYDTDGVEVRLLSDFGDSVISMFLVDTRMTLAEIEAEIRLKFGRSCFITAIDYPSLGVGAAHPRIWRGNDCQRMEETFNAEYAAVRQGFRSLLIRLQEAFAFVEPSSDNISTYGSRFRDILILASTEVEASCRAVLRANQYPPAVNGERLSTKDYVKLRDLLYLTEWTVALEHYPSFPAVSPFRDWTVEAPTQSLGWYDSYNAVKHDRERELSRATLDAAVQSVAAAGALAFAQFGVDPFSNDVLFSELKIVRRPAWRLHDEYIPPWINSSTFWRETSWVYHPRSLT